MDEHEDKTLRKETSQDGDLPPKNGKKTFRFPSITDFFSLLTRIVRNTTVEPVMFFYLLSFTLTVVMEHQFYIDKVCVANFNLSQEICGNLTASNNSEAQILVQRKVSNFMMYNNIIRQVLPVVSGYFLAIWTDRYGPKTAMVVGMIGKAVYFAGYVLNAYYVSWPVEYILFCAALPRAIAGYDISIFMAMYSYLSDVSTPEDRTMRIAILETSLHLTLPVGLALGSYIFTSTGRSYIISFFVSLVVSSVGVVYTVFAIKNIPRPDSDAKGEKKLKMSSCWDVFTDSVRVTFRKRDDNKRMYIVLLLVISLFQSACGDEISVRYLYFQRIFGWGTEEYSNLEIVQTSISIFASLMVIPLLTKVLQVADTHMGMYGVVAFVTSRLCFALATQTSTLFIGCVIGAFYCFTGLSIRSMTSKVTTQEDRGKVFALLSSTESAVSLVSSPMYSQVYNASIRTLPSAPFYVSIGLYCVVFGLFLWMTVSLRGRSLEAMSEEHEEEAKRKVLEKTRL